jgi:hypothetical protein
MYLPSTFLVWYYVFALFNHHNKQFVHTYSSYIVQHNSLRLCMLAYDHMEICISLYHCDYGPFLKELLPSLT